MDIYRDMVYTLALRILGSQPDAEDALQDSFIKVWRHRRNFKQAGDLTAWLARIVTNTCLDRLRYHSRRPGFQAQQDDDPEMQPAQADRTLLTDRQFELMTTLRRAVAKLPRRQATVFILRDLQDLGIADVASVLGISTDTVKSNLYHARRCLRQQLLPLYQGED